MMTTNPTTDPRFQSNIYKRQGLILSGIIVLCVSLAVTLCWLVIQHTERVLIEQQHNELRHLTTQLAEQLQQHIRNRTDALRGLSATIWGAQALTGQGLQHYLEDYQEQQKGAGWTAIVDANGLILASSQHQQVGQSVTTQAWWSTMSKQPQPVTLLQRGEAGGIPPDVGAIIAVPHWTDTKRLHQVLVTSIARTDLAQRIQYSVHGEPGWLMHWWLVTKAGIQILQWDDPRTLGSRLDHPILNRLVTLRESPVLITTPGLNQHEWLTAATPILEPLRREEPEWVMIISLDQDAAMLPVRRIGHYSLSIGLILILPPLLYAGIWIRRVWATSLKHHDTEHQLAQLVNRDSLTGLPNRGLFKDRLNCALARADRNTISVGLMFIDLDRFKQINDTMGHEAGDLVLKTITQRIGEQIRQTDTLARLGGDEFTLIMEQLPSPEYASTLAQRILEVLAQPLSIRGNELFVTASIGLAIYPLDGQEGEQLLRAADIAMYRAKEDGNGYQFYTADMNTHRSHHLTIATYLRYALERNELSLVYQPRVHLGTGQITGVEALIRWEHPERGLLQPSEFIPVAEDTGLIIPIGEWVLRTACLQAKIWEQEGLPPIRIAVNLSSRQFRQNALTKVTSQILHATQFNPRYLELELTESMLIQNVDRAILILNELREMGITIAIDDFGTGYCSFGYLKKFAIQALKIDRIFVRDITLASDAAAIATAIITMGRSLSLSVIAEGVETQEQVELLKQYQCEEGQGYVFSPPVGKDDLAQLIRARNHVPV